MGNSLPPPMPASARAARPSQAARDRFFPAPAGSFAQSQALFERAKCRTGRSYPRGRSIVAPRQRNQIVAKSWLRDGGEPEMDRRPLRTASRREWNPNTEPGHHEPNEEVDNHIRHAGAEYLLEGVVPSELDWFGFSSDSLASSTAAKRTSARNSIPGILGRIATMITQTFQTVDRNR
jgi:hypothetical protein